MKTLGFTLVEMVMVIIVMAILSTFAVSKFSLFSDWDKRAAEAQVPFFFQTAQSIAIANRRTVYIDVNSSGLAACYDATCSSKVYSGGSPLVLTMPGGGVGGSLTSFYYGPSGSPSFSGSKTLATASKTFNVESYSGLVW